jgi:hypothetical protein
MIGKIQQQGQMIRNYEKEIFDLKGQLAEVRRNQ